MGNRYVKMIGYICTWVAGLLLLVFAVPRLLAFFAPIVVGFLLSLIALPLVRFLESKIRIRRKYGSAIIIVVVIALVVLAVYGICMGLIVGVRSFINYVPTLYQGLMEELDIAGERLDELLDRIPAFKDVDLQSLVTSLGEALGEYVTDPNQSVISSIGGFVTSIPDILVSLVVGLLATYYFIADYDKMKVWVKDHTSRNLQERWTRIYNHVWKVIIGYFKAQLKIMMVIYVIVLIGLLLLGVKYAWLIGFGIAFLDMLPVFGTGTVLVPWAIVKVFSGGYRAAVGMLILYVVTLLVHQLIQPKIVGDTVGMNTFLTVIFMFIGYRLRGVLGMIVAIPVGMVIVFLYKEGTFDKLIYCVKELAKGFNEKFTF